MVKGEKGERVKDGKKILYYILYIEKLKSGI